MAVDRGDDRETLQGVSEHIAVHGTVGCQCAHLIDYCAPHLVERGRTAVDGCMEPLGANCRRFEHPQAQRRSMRSANGGHVGHQLVQAFLGRQGHTLGTPGLERNFQQCSVEGLGELNGDRFFGCEMVVDTAGQDSCSLANVIHRGCCVALRSEERPGGSPDLLSTGANLLVGVAGGGFARHLGPH